MEEIPEYFNVSSGNCLELIRKTTKYLRSGTPINRIIIASDISANCSVIK
jgi:hypothetical protein